MKTKFRKAYWGEETMGWFLKLSDTEVTSFDHKMEISYEVIGNTYETKQP